MFVCIFEVLKTALHHDVRFATAKKERHTKCFLAECKKGTCEIRCDADRENEPTQTTGPNEKQETRNTRETSDGRDAITLFLPSNKQRAKPVRTHRNVISFSS